MTAEFGARPRDRSLLEASPEREWVARHLESPGHAVFVADPNDAPLYANRSRRTKTDQGDVRTLMDAGAVAIPPPGTTKGRRVAALRAITG